VAALTTAPSQLRPSLSPGPWPRPARSAGTPPGPLAWALLCALAFSIPLEKGIEISGVGTITRAIGLAAFAVGLIATVRRGSPRPPNAVLLLAGAFALWSGATWKWSAAPDATAARFITLVQLVAMAWLIWELCRTASAQRRLIHAFVAGAAASSGWTIVRAALNRQTNWRRFATAGFDPNDLGVTLAIALTMAVYLGLGARGWRAAWVRFASVLIIVAILLTASRTALVAALVNALFVVLTWRRAGNAQRIASVSLLLLLVLGAVRLAPSASRERLATLPNEVAHGTFHNRTRIWKAGLRLFLHHPVRGVGAAAYPEAAVPWLGRSPLPTQPYTAHNTFLSVLVETGAIGFAIWTLLLAAAVWYAILLAPAERALWFTALAVWATGVFTLAWETRKPTWLILALIMTAWGRAFEPRERER